MHFLDDVGSLQLIASFSVNLSSGQYEHQHEYREAPALPTFTFHWCKLALDCQGILLRRTILVLWFGLYEEGLAKEPERESDIWQRWWTTRENGHISEDQTVDLQTAYSLLPYLLVYINSRQQQRTLKKDTEGHCRSTMCIISHATPVQKGREHIWAERGRNNARWVLGKLHQTSRQELELPCWVHKQVCKLSREDSPHLTPHPTRMSHVTQWATAAYHTTRPHPKPSHLNTPYLYIILKKAQLHSRLKHGCNNDVQTAYI